MTHLSASERAELELERREAARKTTRGFVEYTMPDFEWSWHHDKMCEMHDRLISGEITRAMIEAPPRHTKSEIGTRRSPARFFGLNPTSQFIQLTYNEDFAKDFGGDVRGILQSPEFARVFPNVKLDTSYRAKDKWKTNHGGFYASVGMGGSLTGRGAHVANVDDPFKNREEADSTSRRDLVWRTFTSSLYTRQMPNCRILIQNTRWHEDDLCGRVLDQDGEDRWERLVLPGLDDIVWSEDSKEIVSAEPLWPEWFDLNFHRDQRRMLGDREYSCLYLQDPTPEKGIYFEQDWFGRRYRGLPEQMNYFITADFSLSESSRDFTEIAVWGVDQNDYVYAVDWWHKKCSPSEWLQALLKLILHYRPKYLASESGLIKRAIESALQKGMRDMGCWTTVLWFAPVKSKQERTTSFRAMQESGNVVWPENEPWAERVIAQLMKFPGGKNDDAVDACSLLGQMMHKIWKKRPPRRRDAQIVVSTDELAKTQPARMVDLEPDDAFARMMGVTKEAGPKRSLVVKTL